VSDRNLRRSRVGYLDAAADSDQGRDYKQRMITALGLRPGHRVVDVGCGPGTDLARLAGQVGDGGTVVGVDADPVMVAEAHRRLGGHPTGRVCVGDAHAVPLADASVDAARLDRVAQHVADPARVFTELHRVVRPGGLVAVADPDWDTLVVDDEDADTGRGYARFVATRLVRNGGIGRSLARLAVGAGFTVASVTAVPILFTDFAAGERILRLEHVLTGAVDAGAVDAAAGRRWLARLRAGPFLAAFTLFVVTAHRAAR
jgi:SAM-dependent methyltransferase